MRSIGARIADRLELVAAAAAVLVLGVVVFVVLGDSAAMLLLQTLFWTPLVAVYTVREVRRRQRLLYRMWPMYVAGIVAFCFHCALLGISIKWWNDDLKMPQWIILLFIDLTVAGLVLELAYEYCALSPGTSTRELLTRIRHRSRLRRR